MIKKIFFCIFLFYLLVLFQNSFLVHFNIFGKVPNLILIVVIFINLFTFHRWWGIISALVAGFYLDVFSLSDIGFFGFYTLILMGLSLFLKIILGKYVRIPVVKRA